MKKRKKLIKRIGAVLCAVVVAVSSFCVSNIAYGAYVSNDIGEDVLVGIPDVKYKYDAISDYSSAFDRINTDKYPYLLVVNHYNSSYPKGHTDVLYSDKPILLNVYDYLSSYGVYRAFFHSLGNMYSYSCPSSSGTPRFLNYDANGNVITNNDSASEYCEIVYVNHDIYTTNGRFVFGETTEPAYNSSLGYLQNVTRKSTYIRDAIYNYDNDSLTYHWYHDLQSYSGVDLTSGDYKIRHYISNATVKGYEKEDIIEMSDRYLMAEYDASQGYFSYLQKDYLEKIEELGYVEPSWIDIYLNGYFTLQHHYFQIVNTATNEVGGYLHIYPKDATDDNFGVEMVYEGLDDKLEVDPDAPGGYFDSTTGSGETVEDALENADEPKLDDLSGVEEFIGNVQAYGEEVENVSKGFGAMLGQLPPWVLGAIGIGFGLLVVGGVIKALGG